MHECRCPYSRTLKSVTLPYVHRPIWLYFDPHTKNCSNCNAVMNCNTFELNILLMESLVFCSRKVGFSSVNLRLKIIKVWFQWWCRFLFRVRRLHQKTHFQCPITWWFHRFLRQGRWVQICIDNGFCLNGLWERLFIRRIFCHFYRWFPRLWWANLERRWGNGTHQTVECLWQRISVLWGRIFFEFACQDNRFIHWTFRKVLYRSPILRARQR